MVAPVVVVGVIAAVAAAPGVIRSIKGILDELGFDRSCIIEFINATDEHLQVTVAETESGGWHQPPQRVIPPRSSVVATAGSRFVGEGASGHTTIEADGLTIYADWSCPMVGGNDFDVTVTGPRSGEFAAETSAGAGETNAYLRCEIWYTDLRRYDSPAPEQPANPAPRPMPKLPDLNQRGWRWCSACECLTFGTADCYAGTRPHKREESGEYGLPLGRQPAQSQAGWKWCRNCQCLAFSAGVCASSSRYEPHDFTGSGEYSIQMFDGPVRGYQDGWRWCSMCQCLAYADGACATEQGFHDFTGSGNYSLWLY